MFKLTETEIENAIKAIEFHGYSALLPEPIEWQVVLENRVEITNYIKELDLDNYKPFKPMKVFAPKNRANIRVVHLLHPQDLIIYTALTIIVKNDIEAGRISKKAKRVFSYRVDTSKSDRLYDARGAHDEYLSYLKKKSDKKNIKFVGIADIADFYPRIYQHRLENVIETIATDNRSIEVARVLVKKLISNLMGRNSYGIPVGPYASRVLAEAVLIDVDAFLYSKNIDFVRWVDDYNIFCKSEYEAQSTLFGLGEWLYTNHGLTFQSAKTKILPVKRYLGEILIKPDDQLSNRDQAVEFLQDFTSIYEEIDEEDLDEGEIQEVLLKLQEFDLLGMLNESVSDQNLVDYEIVKYVLTKLNRVPGVSEDLKKQVLDFVIENAELLYPVTEQIAKYVQNYSGLTRKEKKDIAKLLLKPLKSKRNPPPNYYAMWILWIFSTSEDWNHSKDIIELYQNSNSEVLKRYAALAIGKCGNRAEALVIKNDFPASSDILKLAILSSSNKLGKDERKHWKLANQIDGILEKKI
ncbi:MAG: RNA-directed DNA polymerase [Balneola sp.]|nr:MAG: RNA-directed DNA polymerase [Balneola sp.]